MYIFTRCIHALCVYAHMRLDAYIDTYAYRAFRGSHSEAVASSFRAKNR